MKYISLLLMFISLGVYAIAQDPKPEAARVVTSDAKIITELTSSSAIKNAPFSADAISESVQTLADGNRIVRSSTSKLYRNSEGRFRREMTGGTGGMLGSLYSYSSGVSLLDPVGGFSYMIDPNLKTTRQFIYKPGTAIKVLNGATTVEGSLLSDKVRAEIKAAAAVASTAGGNNAVIVSDKVREELKATIAAAPVIAARAGQLTSDALTGVGMAYSVGSSHSKWETRTEELGTQNIEGVDAEGTRTITTIPAGAIGNERPIEITYEKWYSRELQLVVMSKHNDPRFGEQTYRLTNIVRSEPDPSLFSLPNGYKLITEPAGTYTVSPTKAAWVEKATTPKAAQSATTVTKAKP